MKPKLFALMISVSFIFSCGSKTTESNELEATTDAAEWITLFNGTDFAGWEMYGPEPFTEHWSIVDGAIACNAGIGEENVGFFRSIMTKQDFSNFELELEYRIAKGGNSGIFYHVVEKEEWGHDYMSGPEYQILDDEYSRSESEPFKMVASNYAMHAPAETKKPKPFMEWNKVKIIYNNGLVEHWLNDEKVLEFIEGSEEWTARKDRSKWANVASYAASKKGRISLQNHGDEVYYRNIRIKEL